MKIDTEEWLDQEEAFALLRKRGFKKSIMWLKQKVMYGVIPSERFWNSRVIHKNEVEKLLKAAVFVIALLLAAGTAWATPPDITNIVAAIYKAEGGAVGRYGIKSEACETLAECKRICENSVRNNIKRWEAAGKPGDFISFMGKRYAPVDAHPLNKNWVPNVRKFLEK